MSFQSSNTDADVLIIGAGPAGLAAALELRRRGVGRVVVVDREEQVGGTPRHAAHIGFGLRDMHRLLTGPQYAARYVRLAKDAGIDLRPGVSVTHWSGPRSVTVTGPGGRGDLTARAIVLATGCRERPRAARLIPGTRPLGVFTTGALQQFVHLHHQPVGNRAVVVGAEHVRFSAVLTLAHAGASTAAMITEHARHQTYLPYKWLSATRLRVPILTSTRVTQILGRQRVEAVEITNLRTGAVHRLACDTVVFTGDWIPDSELARRAGLAMDPATRGPRVDFGSRTSVPGVFAVGNLVHAAETADIAALSGWQAARALHAFLRSDYWPSVPPLPVACETPVQWASPSAINAQEPRRPPHGHFILRVSEFRAPATLTACQAGRVLWRRRYRRLVPGLPIHAAAPWLAQVDPTAGAVTFRLEDCEAGASS